MTVRLHRNAHRPTHACITSSIELACLREPETYEYIFHDEIAAQAGGLAFYVTYENRDDRTVTPGKRPNLKPDRAFGIRNLKEETTRYYLLEVDRGTETLATDNSTRKSLLDNDLQYRQFIGGLEYKEALDYAGGIVLLNLMTSPARMRNLMRLIRPSNYMAFKAMPQFAPTVEFTVPAPMPELLTEAWERPGREPFYINK